MPIVPQAILDPIRAPKVKPWYSYQGLTLGALHTNRIPEKHQKITSYDIALMQYLFYTNILHCSFL
jgi:hypothetical protein